MTTRNVTIANGIKVAIIKTARGYEYRGYLIVKNYQGVWCCVEHMDELENGVPAYQIVKNLSAAVEKINFWTETPEEEAQRMADKKAAFEAEMAAMVARYSQAV